MTLQKMMIPSIYTWEFYLSFLPLGQGSKLLLEFFIIRAPHECLHMEVSLSGQFQFKKEVRKCN